MEHAAAHSNEDRFRCFIYEEWRGPSGQVEGYHIAISGDATCDGVQSPNEGSTLLVSIKRSLRAVPLSSCLDSPVLLRSAAL